MKNTEFDIKKQQTSPQSERSPGTTSRRQELSAVDDSVPQNEEVVNRGEIGKDFKVKADSQSGSLEISLITERFGAEGRVKYAVAYENELNSGFNNTEAEFLRSYSRYYLLGLNGKKITDIPSKYADRISQSARKTAYKAGVADRKINLDNQYKQANNAVVKDGGLIRNHNSYELSDAVNDMMDKLGKIFGVTVTVKDKVYNQNGKEVNGKYSNGEIELSYDKIKNDTPEEMAARLIRHEITHRIQELAPKQYDKFRKLAFDYAEKHINNGTISLAEKYADNRNLNLNDAIDEVVADLMGIEEFARDIVGKDLTLAQKIKGIIKDLLDVTGLRKYSEVERIERAWEKAIESAKNQVKKNSSNSQTVVNSGVEKYSYDGKTKSGIRKYISDFPEGMSESEKVKVFKSRIATIFNLGAVSLKTGTKRIEIKGDKFTATKNLRGDEKGTRQEMSAKINSLYDLADILATSSFVKSEIEESYKDSNISPKNKAHKNVKYWYKFKNRIYLDDVLYDITFSIRDKGKEQYQYFIDFKSVKKESDNAKPYGQKDLLLATKSPSTNNISQISQRSQEKNSEGDMDELFQMREERDGTRKIVENMSEAERYEILKNRKITPPISEISQDVDIDLEYLAKNIKSTVEKGLLQKFRQLGLLKKYKSIAVGDISFDFTGKGFYKSIHSQENFYGGNKADFAKVILNLQEVLDASVLLEVHQDKGKGTSREKRGLEKVYVLFSALNDGGEIIPIQFEVEQYANEENRLYLAVALTKIETGVKGNTAPDVQKATSLLPVSEISIADLFSKINPADKNFLKYIPNQFLNKEQIKAKKIALEIEKRKYSTEKYSEGDFSELLDKAQSELEGLISEYGIIEQGENPARDVRLPKQTGKGEHTRRYARTVAEAEVMNDEAFGLCDILIINIKKPTKKENTA